MNRVCCYCLAMTMASGVLTARAEEPHISREAIEWCNIWIPDANDTKLPRVLLIGDSITGGYGPKVADALTGKSSVARLTTSKSIGDPALLAEVALVLGQCRFDVVHFNNGLHGWGYTEDEYQRHFPALVATIRKYAPQAKLIWATITPMRQAGKLDVIAEGTLRQFPEVRVRDLLEGLGRWSHGRPMRQISARDDEQSSLVSIRPVR